MSTIDTVFIMSAEGGEDEFCIIFFPFCPPHPVEVSAGRNRVSAPINHPLIPQTMNKFAYLLSALLVTGLSTVATAQTAPKAKTAKSMGKMSKDYCMMKDGKMMMMKGGKMMPMTENMTMSDGTMCMTDGTCMKKDGTKMTMTNGQCMMMDGKMTTMDEMKKGGKMKPSGKMGNMKM